MTTKPDPRIVISRPDGRPEAYDVVPGQQMQCVICAYEGHPALLERGKIVMASPIDTTDGQPHFVCIEKHVPDDIVIYDPITETCRDKSGQNVWKEI